MGRTYNGKDISAAWGVALARHPRMHPVGLQAGSHSASLSAEQGSWVPGRLLYTSLRHSQPRHLRSTTRHYPTVPRYRLNTFGRSAFFVAWRWSDGLKLATGQSPRPGAQQQQLQRIANDESILSLQLTTPEAHSTVEMLHESALYKSIINTDIDIDLDKW